MTSGPRPGKRSHSGRRSSKIQLKYRRWAGSALSPIQPALRWVSGRLRKIEWLARSIKVSISGHVVRLKGTAHVSGDRYFDSLFLWERVGGEGWYSTASASPLFPNPPSRRRENESEME